MERAKDAPQAMASGAGEKLRSAQAEGLQLDLLGGPAVPAALTPAYEPAPPPPQGSRP